jgi:AcrR family transcriptional regulator
MPRASAEARAVFWGAYATSFAYLVSLMASSSTPPTTGQPSARSDPRSRAAGSRRGASLRPDDGRLERGRRSRARIREAARDLFREVGFDRATLRAIAARAGMGASSIYRHVQSKEELLIDELAALQQEAWRRFRAGDDRDLPTRERVQRFLALQHELFMADRDLTMIALRAATRPDAQVARRALGLGDQTVGLIAEILQMGRRKRDLRNDLDVLEAARVIYDLTQGARIPWAHGMLSAERCRQSIDSAVDLLFRGIQAGADEQSL